MRPRPSHIPSRLRAGRGTTSSQGTFVLRNKFTGPGKPYGETDPAKLTALEEQGTRLRLMELRTSPIVGGLDYDHMKAIHRHVLQVVYEWAGEERTAPTAEPMTKEGTGPTTRQGRR